jgi:hypothetical protein|tara:strand:+ start:988 stop:1254 length:267 start_codon:yes stop_codon:yes gene_type:complete
MFSELSLDIISNTTNDLLAQDRAEEAVEYIARMVVGTIKATGCSAEQAYDAIDTHLTDNIDENHGYDIQDFLGFIVEELNELGVQNLH